MPETPRYYSWSGRNDDAWRVIQRLHHDPNDPGDTAAWAEFVQITKQVEFDKGQKAGYIEMFKKPSWRKRSILVLFIMYVLAQRPCNLQYSNTLLLLGLHHSPQE